MAALLLSSAAFAQGSSEAEKLYHEGEKFQKAGKMDEACVAYLESYAMVTFLVQQGGLEGLDRFIGRLLRTRDLNRSLKKIYRRDLEKLEADLRQTLR